MAVFCLLATFPLLLLFRTVSRKMNATKNKYAIGLVFAAVATALAIFLLAMIHHDRPFIPWSVSNMEIPGKQTHAYMYMLQGVDLKVCEGLNGFTQFGLMDVRVCAFSKCKMEDYAWLSRVTKIFGTDSSVCEDASKSKDTRA
jgi:hypothetical protein